MPLVAVSRKNFHQANNPFSTAWLSFTVFVFLVHRLVGLLDMPDIYCENPPLRAFRDLLQMRYMDNGARGLSKKYLAERLRPKG